jgi:hypothetical protein
LYCAWLPRRAARPSPARVEIVYAGRAATSPSGESAPNAEEEAQMARGPAWHRVLVMTLALTAPPRTLIRNAAQVLTMDPALGAGDLGVREHVDTVTGYP